MKLYDYYHFNDTCPVCGKALTLYLHASKSALWKGTPVDREGNFHFERTILKENEYSVEDTFEMNISPEKIEFTFNSDKLVQEAKTWQFFLFNICNVESFKDNKWDYDINLYDACYYRCSPWHQFSPDTGTVEMVNPDQATLINRDETMLFKIKGTETVEKVYALNLDHENKHTKLWFYTTTEEQRKTEDFEPNIFEKTDLPLLPTRPDLDMQNRDKLISRLDSWILLS